MRAELVITFTDGGELRRYIEAGPSEVDRQYQAWCQAEHYAGRTIADVELLYGWTAMDMFALILFVLVIIGLIMAWT